MLIKNHINQGSKYISDRKDSLILTKFRAEVKKMSILEYNARLHEETLKKEGVDFMRMTFEKGFSIQQKLLETE